MIKEFKPALLFVAKFLVIYFVGNVIYGVYVESFNNVADPMTNWVTIQSAQILNLFVAGVESYSDPMLPKVHLLLNNRTVISVYEGCNGLNVIIIFVAFLAAYGGRLKRLSWFVPLGIVIIHLFNLARIALLYYVAEYHHTFMYFTHKYLFTATIYVVVLALWYWWATKLSK